MKLNTDRLFVVKDPSNRWVRLKSDIFSGEPMSLQEIGKTMSRRSVFGVYTTKSEAQAAAAKLYPKLKNRPVGMVTFEPNAKNMRFILSQADEKQKKTIEGWVKRKSILLRITPTFRIPVKGKTPKNEGNEYLLKILRRKDEEPLLGMVVSLRQIRDEILD